MAGARRKERYASAMQCGAKIAEVRKARGFTLKRVAETTGFSPQQIFLVEKGEINTPIETLARIAEALEVPLAILVGGVKEKHTCLSVEDNEYYQLFKELCQRIALPSNRQGTGTAQSSSSQNQSYLYQEHHTFDDYACAV